MTEVEKAEAIVADLEAQRAAAGERHAKAAETRQVHAFAALAERDKGAQTKLQMANNAAMVADTEITSFDAAISEAKRRLAEARRAEAAEAERAAARLVPPITTRLRERGARLDALLSDLVSEYTALLEDVHELHRHGFTSPTSMLVKSGARRAAQTAFTATDLETERVPPSQRHTFTELTAGWSMGIDARVAAVLGDLGAAA